MSMKGKFVRWTSTDADGEFSHVGECVGDSKTMMILNTAKGEMLINKSEGSFEVTRKPRNFKAGGSADAAPAEKAEKPAAEKKAAPKRKAKSKSKSAPKATKARTPRAGSKIAQAVEILSNADRAKLSRQEMIKMLEEQMGIEDHKRASGLYNAAIKKVA